MSLTMLCARISVSEAMFSYANAPNKGGGFFKSHAAAEELAGLLPEGAEEAVWAACARFSVLCCAAGTKAR